MNPSIKFRLLAPLVLLAILGLPIIAATSRTADATTQPLPAASSCCPSEAAAACACEDCACCATDAGCCCVTGECACEECACGDCCEGDKACGKAHAGAGCAGEQKDCGKEKQADAEGVKACPMSEAAPVAGGCPMIH